MSISIAPEPKVYVCVEREKGGVARLISISTSSKTSTERRKEQRNNTKETSDR